MNESTITPITSEEQDIHLLNYLVILHRRKWVIVSGFIAVMVLVAFYLIYKPAVPMYETTSKIVLAPEQLQDIVPGAPHLQNLDLETQIEIIKTLPVLGRVIQQLDLSDAEEGTPGFKAAVNNLANSLNVEFVGDTLIVSITAIHRDPSLARDVANAVAQAYADYDRQSHLQAGRDAIAWLTKEIADISTKLRNAERAFQDFKEKEGIVTLNIKQNEDASELTKLNSNYVSAKSKRMELEAILRHLREDSLTVTEIPPDVLTTQSLQNLNPQLVSLQMELAEKQKIFTGKYPTIIKLKSDIEFTNQRFVEELQAQLKALMAQEDFFLNALNAKKSAVLSLGGKEIEYLNLEREVTTNRGLHNLLLTRVQEFSLIDNSYFSDVRILEYAELPTIPQKPKKLSTIAVGVVLGLIVGIGLAFFVEYMDRSVCTPDDVSRHLELPVLGLVPLDEEARKASPSPIIVSNENGSLTAEAYRTLGTNFLFSGFPPRTRGASLSDSPSPLRTVMVTSAMVGEGKSMTVVNLGVVLAQMERKILLIDADLRRPVLHKVFGINRLKGLSAVFADEVTIEDAIAETSVPNLKVLPAGSSPTNPPAVLGNSRMKQILADLREDYDFILVDSAPVLGLADGIVLANIVDAALLLIKAGSTASRPAKMAAQQIQQVNGNLLGVVLNSIDLSKDRYYYHRYYYHYDYKEYGEGNGQSKKVKKRKLEESVVSREVLRKRRSEWIRAGERAEQRESFKGRLRKRRGGIQGLRPIKFTGNEKQRLQARIGEQVQRSES